MLKTIKVRIESIAPMLMHNGMMADPLNPQMADMKEVSKKRNKTDADHMTMARLEWYAGLYTDNGRVVVPAINIERCVIMGARKARKGKEVESGFIVVGDSIPLEFPDEDMSIDELYQSGKYEFRCLVSVQKAKIARVRPRFNEWALNFDAQFDDEVINEKDILTAIETAGRLIGLGDFRPRFGRFAVV